MAKENNNERGVTMVEYSLLAALIALVCIAGIVGIGIGVQNDLCQMVNGDTNGDGAVDANDIAGLVAVGAPAECITAIVGG